MTDKCPKCRAVEVSSFKYITTFLCGTTTWRGTVKDETRRCLRNHIDELCARLGGTLDNLDAANERIAELEAIVDKLRKALETIPDDEYENARLYGCDSNAARDAQQDAIHEHVKKAMDGEVGTEALRGDDEN